MKSLLLALTVFLPLAAQASTKNILVTGYWPPTNKMLTELKEHGKNWRGLGYDIYAYYPSNTEKDGVGEGDFRVDFASVYNDFMRVTRELEPVAILSFGAGAGPWELENIFYPHFSDWFVSGEIPSSVGVKTVYAVPESLKAKVERYSSLPLGQIEAAVEKLGDTGLRPWIDKEGGAGDFVCAFTGYLETWYQSEHADPRDPAHVKAAGFIHVNGEEAEAKASMEASLKALILSLDPVQLEP
jgi:hypothetical protein